MARFDDGVYLEWSKYGDKELDQPRSIAVIENEFILIHVNPTDPTVIRFPYRSSMGMVREFIKNIENYEEYVDRSHELLMNHLRPTVNARERIQHFPSGSVSAITWKSVGESWWTDFDELIELAHPRLMAWAKSIGPCQWLVTVGRRSQRPVVNTSRPLMQFTIWGKGRADLNNFVDTHKKQIVENLILFMSFGLENREN
jgi:hypothetical protein